jgi:hypothetical protein
MTSNELRSKYLSFFKSRGHAAIQGKSLLPELLQIFQQREFTTKSANPSHIPTKM